MSAPSASPNAVQPTGVAKPAQKPSPEAKAGQKNKDVEPDEESGIDWELDSDAAKPTLSEINDALRRPARRSNPKLQKIKQSVGTLEQLRKSTAIKHKESNGSDDGSPLSTPPASPAQSDGEEEDTDMLDADDAEEEFDSEKPASDENGGVGGTALSFKDKISAALSNARKSRSTSQPKSNDKKRGASPSPSPGPKKARHTKHDRTAENAKEVQLLPYQSIISIDMPPRPGNPKTAPDPDNLPFGPTENYENSMIIHYMDELEMTYTKAADVYSEHFPNDALTDEAVRKRHIRSLLRLKKRYGVRDPDTIDVPCPNVKRRGTKRAKRIADIAPVDPPVPSNKPASAPPQLQAHAAANKRAAAAHLFEKILIVVWRDEQNLGWKAIQNKLEDEYKWSLGQGTIEKYYYYTLERVYGKGGKKEKNREDKAKGEEEESKKEWWEWGTENVRDRRMSF